MYIYILLLWSIIYYHVYLKKTIIVASVSGLEVSSILKIKEQFRRNSMHPPFHPVKTYRKRKYREQEIKTARKELEIEHSNYFLIRENLVSTFPPFYPIDDVTFDEKKTTSPGIDEQRRRKRRRRGREKRARMKQKGAETRLEGKQDVERVERGMG